MPEQASENVLVIGMGNVPMQDEGIGVRAVEELESRYQRPANVRIMDGDTTDMELFEPMRGADCLIIAEAVNADRPPGSLLRIANGEIRAAAVSALCRGRNGVEEVNMLLVGEQPVSGC